LGRRYRLANLLPVAAQNRALKAQWPSLPFLMAQPPTDDRPANVVDGHPFYARANVGHIADIRAAAELVKLLTPSSQPALAATMVALA
jgi:nitronate monooxygenase